MLTKALALLVPLLAPTVLFFVYVYLRRRLFGDVAPRTAPWLWLSVAGLLLVAGAIAFQWSEGVGGARDTVYTPARMAPDGSIIPPTTRPRGE